MAAYKYSSTSTIHPSPRLQNSDDCYMPKPQPFNILIGIPIKRQKLDNSKGSQPPSAFWNNLSKIWLTKRALERLDQSNSSSSPRYQQSHRPITRHTVAKWKKDEYQEPAANFLAACSAKQLADIKLFARHGGPDLSNLRGFQKSANPLDYMMDSSQPSYPPRKVSSASRSKKPTTNTTTTKNTRPYDRNFQQNLIDHGIYPSLYEYPNGQTTPKPNNLEEIKHMLAQPRRSLSPSIITEETHEKFVRKDTHAAKEDQVTKLVIPIIEGEITDVKCTSGKIPFSNLQHLTDGTLVSGNPDLFYGARPEQLKQKVRNDLSGHIIPSTQHDLPIVPNFFLAAKGPDGSLAIAGRQASYDGALGARGILSLQSYGQETVYDNNAYTITSIYHGGTLKMYTSHPTQPKSPGSQPEIFMTPINTWAMTGNVSAFREGATAFRNAKDWTKEQRDKAIECANERADNISSTTQISTSLASGSTSETFDDENTSSPGPESQSQEETAHELKKSTNMNPPAKRLLEPSQPQSRKRNTGPKVTGNGEKSV